MRPSHQLPPQLSTMIIGKDNGGKNCFDSKRLEHVAHMVRKVGCGGSAEMKTLAHNRAKESYIKQVKRLQTTKKV